MFRQGFSKILIVVIVLAIIAGGALVWQQLQAPKEEAEEPAVEAGTPVAGEEEVPAPEEGPADETADWKTYRNEEYGYEVKYPEVWYVTDDKGASIDEMLLSRVIFDDEPQEGAIEESSILITVENRPFEEALSVFQYGPLISPITEKKLVVDGTKAIKQSASVVSDVSGKTEEVRVLISKNNKVYTLTAMGEARVSILDKMLSTFQFID